ncbi:hypothetical protein TNCV_4521171 [Trichonephila clavipes]|nr:hypothetical protein TNCV_4521171 [Trichonephila clavipes]
MSKRCLHMMEKLSSSEKIMICLISIYLSYSPCLFRFFLYVSDSPLVSMEIPLRTAYSQNGRYGMQPKPSSFARRRSELKLKLELVEEKQKLLDIRERKKNARGARAGVTF